MTRQSVDAYDLPKRVARYDADMAVMHPNRSKMVDVALAVLDLDRGAQLKALDLGPGTGYFPARFLEAFPVSRAEAIDGAEAMLDLARERLGPAASRVTFRGGDFRDLARMCAGG